MVIRYFISFASETGISNVGTSNLLPALKRLLQQAADIDMFDDVRGYTENDLKKDNAFWNKHSEFIEKNPRGFGYWIWKPYLIQKTLNKMNEDDILLYLDSGCEIKASEKERLNLYFDLIKTDPIIASLADPGFDDGAMTKADLLDKLGMNDPKYFTAQRQATAIMIRKTKETVKLVNEWYELAGSDNYHYLDDSPSNLPNNPRFKEHRHDQSIFSLLTKKYNLFSEKDVLGSPIYVIRNRTGTSVIEGFSNPIYLDWVYLFFIFLGINLFLAVVISYLPPDSILKIYNIIRHFLMRNLFRTNPR